MDGLAICQRMSSDWPVAKCFEVACGSSTTEFLGWKRWMAIISWDGSHWKTKMTFGSYWKWGFPMSCYFSRMVMINDNGDDDHVYSNGKVLEFGEHCFFTSEFGLATNSCSSSTATLQGLSDILIYNQILSCVPTSHLAVSLLQQLRNEKLRPTEITFGACLNACVKNGQWKMALAIQDILCDEIGWRISCILKRTTVRFFSL